MKKYDLFVIAVVLTVAGVLGALLYFGNNFGSYVQVEIDGEIVETVSLSKDFEKEYNFDGDTNTLVIKDAKAIVSHANCKDKICVNHMPVSRAGESIICLPHKFVVTVRGGAQGDNEIDAVA